jgi:hypothetical protein
MRNPFKTPEQESLYRADEQIESDIRNSPLHQMPRVINRHEPDLYVQRRSHLTPEELTEYTFDENNQPLSTPPHRPSENPKFAENVSKPDGGNRPATSNNHSDPQSVA